MNATRAELEAAGKRLRRRCSRNAHGKWEPQARRQDPVDLLIEATAGRLAQLIPIRNGRMMESPFAFYRGAAAIMAADLARSPATGIRVQACGDCHLLNFGAYTTPERHVVFDINDFDETLQAPWEWDVKRLAASLVIAAQHNSFSNDEARDIATGSVTSYREHMKAYAGMRVLERWYQRLEVDELFENIRPGKWRRDVEERIRKAQSQSVLVDEFPKLATMKNGKARIKDNPPLIFHQTEVSAGKFNREIHAAFRSYQQTLADDRRAMMDRFEFSDIAMKVVGVGSVGTRCAIMLMMAGSDDPLFLQVKEAQPSVLERHAGRSRYSNHGHRIVAGQRLMQAASDIFLGWTQVEDRHFYVRQLRDMKIKPLAEGFDVRRLHIYGRWCGWALARAHAKTGDAAMISGYLGGAMRFDKAIGRFAMAYAEQNERDYERFVEAIRNGKIKAVRE